jgi:hypothetical protein
MNEIFMKCLKPIAEMMRQQLALAEKSKLQVEVFTDSEPSGCPLRTSVLKTPPDSTTDWWFCWFSITAALPRARPGQA